MTASLSQRFATPVVVDSSFLRELDGRLRALRPHIIAQFAGERNLDAGKLTEQVERAAPPSDTIDAIHYNEALAYVEPKYSIRWKNDVNLRVSGVEAAIEALELEYTMPTRIEGEIGSYGRTYMSLAVDGSDLYPSRLSTKGSIESVRNARDSAINFLKKHTPDYSILHDSRLKIVLLGAILIFSLVSSFYNGFGFASADTNSKKIETVIGTVIGVLIWTFVYWLFGKSFPVVVWKFGAGRKQAVFQKVFIGLVALLVSAIIIPIILR